MKNFHELRQVETTGSSNGYPENLKFAYVGFDDWEELEDFIDKNPEFEPILLKRNDGQTLWSRAGSVSQPLYNSASDYGDDYAEFDNMVEEDEFISEEIAPFVGDFYDFDSLQDFINEKKRVFREIEDLGDSQIVITYRGAYYETIERVSLYQKIDTTAYYIGVIEK